MPAEPNHTIPSGIIMHTIKKDRISSIRLQRTLCLLALSTLFGIPSAHAQESRPPSEQPSAISLHDAAQKWAAFVDGQYGEDDFSGGIHVSQGQEVVHEQFWGSPVQHSDKPFNRDTRFNIASMGKMFTAVAIGQLVESGRLSWHDTVDAHFPEFPWTAYADQITVEQLLSHQSGLGNYPFNHDLRQVEAIVDHGSDVPVAFEPGAQMGYSNMGYAVLGVIIERVSGMSYYDYVRTHVFERIGMARSGFFDAMDPVDNMAMGYTSMQPDGSRLEGERVSNAAAIERIGSPGGGAYSTLSDLQRFALALQEDRLVDRETRNELWRGRVLMGGSTWYALGFGVRTSGGARVVGHNGGAPGIGAVLQLFPETGVLAVAFTNQDPEPIIPMTREIVRLVTSIPE